MIAPTREVVPGWRERAVEVLKRVVLTFATRAPEDASLAHWRSRFAACDPDALARSLNPPIHVSVVPGGFSAVVEDGNHRTTAAIEARASAILAEARLGGGRCWCGTGHGRWRMNHPPPGPCPGCRTGRRITALVRLP
jgi:hypothetical protein